MMNKLWFAAICALGITSVVWSVDVETSYNKKVSDLTYFFMPPAAGKSDKTANEQRNEEIGLLFKGKTVYYFDGFDFENYKKSDPNMSQLSTKEVEAIKNGVTNPSWKQGDTGAPQYKVTAAAKPYTIIGHSQGGLRALGYISYLKRDKAERVKDIDAVITISGIDQGLKALDGGLGGFKSRTSEKINIVGNGFRAAAGIFDLFGNLQFQIPRNQLANAFDFFIWLIPPAMRHYSLAAWQSTRDADFPQIRDMVPRSDYIRQNVAESTDHAYKKKTGQELAAEWRYTTKLFGIKVWYLWIGMRDVYTTYNAVEVKPVFDPSVPVGFIVGLNNKTLEMNEEKTDTVKTVVKTFEISFAVVEGIHIAKCVGLVGLFTGSVTYAADADRARRLFANMESELNDIKRSSANDGLVAAESQYIPATFRNPATNVETKNLKNPVLGNAQKGYVGLDKRNHIDIVQKIDAFKKATEMADEGTNLRKKQGLPR